MQIALVELWGINRLTDLRGSLLWTRGVLILAAVAAVSSLVTTSTTKLVLLVVILRLYKIRGRGRPVNVNLTPHSPPAPAAMYYYDHSDSDSQSDSSCSGSEDDSDSEEELLMSSSSSSSFSSSSPSPAGKDEEKEEEDNRADGDWLQQGHHFHLLCGSDMAARCGRGVVKSWVDDTRAIDVGQGLGLLLSHDDACNWSITPTPVPDLNPAHQLLVTSFFPVSSSTTTRADHHQIMFPPASALATSVPIVAAVTENGGSTLAVRVWDPRSKGQPPKSTAEWHPHPVRRMVVGVTASCADGESKVYLHDELGLVPVVDLRNSRSPLWSDFVN